MLNFLIKKLTAKKLMFNFQGEKLTGKKLMSDFLGQKLTGKKSILNFSAEKLTVTVLEAKILTLPRSIADATSPASVGQPGWTKE